MLFKNHNPGFIFIEIIVAIALLAVFGTNLFISQAQIFSNINKTHRKVLDVMLSSSIIPDFIKQLSDTKKEQKPIDSIVINKDIQSAQIHIEIKKIMDKSELFENFENYIQIVEQTIIYDNKKNKMISFLFTPPQTKENNSPKQTNTGVTT